MSAGERIPTTLRSIMVLETIGRSDRAMTATEVGAALGLPKQTVNRLCATLESAGYLTRAGRSKRFQPARRLREMGAGLLHNSRDHILRHQILAEVAREVRETVNFVVPGDAGMSYIDRVEADWVFRVQLPVGSQVPFHCTASGKCFLASLSAKERRRFAGGLALDRHTAATHTEPGALLDELKEIRRLGYALDRQEFLEGMVAIAVPVTDASGRFIAALAVHGPTPRIVIEDAISHKAFLQEAAGRLSRALFGEA